MNINAFFYLGQPHPGNIEMLWAMDTTKTPATLINGKIAYPPLSLLLLPLLLLLVLRSLEKRARPEDPDQETVENSLTEKRNVHQHAATALGPWEPLATYVTSPLSEDLGQFSLTVTPGSLPSSWRGCSLMPRLRRPVQES